MIRNGQPITFRGVARTAGCSIDFLYGTAELGHRIEQPRRAPAALASAHGENLQLRRKLGRRSRPRQNNKARAMKLIVVRNARQGDGKALARIHAEVARYYLELAPDYFQIPTLEEFAEELDAKARGTDSTTLKLVAEIDGEVVGALLARLLPPEDEAARQTSRDPGETRLRIDYLATSAASRRQGVGGHLVEAAEAWGRNAGATVAETWTYHRSPLSVPFWEERMGYEGRSVYLRKPL